MKLDNLLFAERFLGFVFVDFPFIYRVVSLKNCEA